MKYYFLTANENLSSGLLQSQLVKPVQLLGKNNAIIININRPFSKKYKSSRLKVINIPFLIPYFFINYRPIFFINELICLFYAFLLAIRIPKLLGSGYIVTRSYVPGLVGWWLNKLFKTQFIFDPRSLYVHEHIGAGKIKEDSLNQKYWLWVERRLVDKSMATVCVSKGMSEYYAGLSAHNSNKMIMIPCFADSLIQKTYDEDNRLTLRMELGYVDSDIIIVYYGSLDKGWNNLAMYINYFKKIVETGAKVLIISQDAASLRKTELANMEHIKILGGTTIIEQQEALQLLELADYGIVVMGNVPDWKTRLSVKFVQYTSSGLPVIVNNYVGEAVRLIRNNNLIPSVIWDGSEKKLKLRKSTSDEKMTIRKWADQYFDQRNILKYFEVGK